MQGHLIRDALRHESGSVCRASRTRASAVAAACRARARRGARDTSRAWTDLRPWSVARRAARVIACWRRRRSSTGRPAGHCRSWGVAGVIVGRACSSASSLDPQRRHPDRGLSGLALIARCSPGARSVVQAFAVHARSPSRRRHSAAFSDQRQARFRVSSVDHRFAGRRDQTTDAKTQPRRWSDARVKRVVGTLPLGRPGHRDV